MKETGKAGGNLQHKEWKALKQRLEPVEIINQRHEQEKTSKKFKE